MIQEKTPEIAQTKTLKRVEGEHAKKGIKNILTKNLPKGFDHLRRSQLFKTNKTS